MAFVAGILGITLAELGKQVGLAVAGAAATKAFNAITSSSTASMPDPSLRKSVDEALQRLSAIRADIANTSNQIANLQFSLKKDKIEEFVTVIEALDDQYWQATAALGDASKMEAGDAKTKLLQRCQERNQELGRRVSNEVYLALKQIHVLLAEQGADSLLSLVSQQSIKDNDDMFVHYCKFRAVLVHYFLLQSRAIALFETVVADPNVNFTEGQKLIGEVNTRIKKQEEHFYSLFPKPIADVCAKLSLQPDQPLSINWASVKSGGAANGGVIVQPHQLGSMGYVRDCPHSSKSPDRWILRPKTKLVGPSDLNDKTIRNEFYIYRPLDDDQPYKRKYMVAQSSGDSRYWGWTMIADGFQMGGSAEESAKWTPKMTSSGGKITLGFVSWLDKLLFLCDDGDGPFIVGGDKDESLRGTFEIRLW